MLFGPRPSLGWLAYLMLGGSWRRYTIMLVAFCLISLFIVDEGKKMVTLRHLSPAPFPPPVTFVHSPDNPLITPLDACSVEAASAGIEKGQMNRRVYVYLWKETITPADEWANWMLRLPMIQVTNMDLPSLVSGPLSASLKKAAFMSTWQKWLAARLGILWKYGGVSMSFGSIMTKALHVEFTGPHTGIIVEGENQLLDPVLLATPPHHPAIAVLAAYLVNDTSSANRDTEATLGQLLTKAFLNGCGVDRLTRLPSSSCRTFNFIARNKTFSIEKDAGHPEDALLIRYPEELYTFRDDKRFLRYFQANHLERFCPITARHLEMRVVAEGI
ncbi:uncharacterized protein LOC135224517 [Macrobrachium nipponense]|uniref:uncharacterized protein LOC135224517 n=1 Tax=Macrobrachium nipponense TaxID=159736 RepID=UPI0030C8C4BF